MTERVVPARYYRRISEVLAREGIDIGRVFSAADLNPAMLVGDDSLLEIAQIERLVAALLEQTGRRDLALDVGRHIQLASHSLVSYGILSSPSVDYALRLTSRYFGLIFPPFRMRYLQHSDQRIVEFQPRLPMTHDCLEFHIEVVAVAAHFDVQELLGRDLPPYDLALSIAEPAHAHRYRELRGARCQFGVLPTPGIRMQFPAEIGHHRPATADPALLAMAEQRCSSLLSNAVSGGKVSDWVRMMLNESSMGMPSLAELAHTLNISTRTLERHLQREDASFRELSQQARHLRARRLLANPQQSITRIAYELGYADAANFTRAFRRLEGCSPSTYREHLPTPG